MGMILGPTFNAIVGDGALVLEELGLPADAAILDIGTGEGLFATYLSLQGFQVLAGEPTGGSSPYACTDWAAKAKKVGVLSGIHSEPFDANKMPFDSEAFDAVFFFGTFHLIDEEARQDVFREALRVSKRSGAVVFFEPQREMLEDIWIDDPNYHLASNPSDYVADQTIQEHRIEGSLMEMFIYRHVAQGNTPRLSERKNVSRERSIQRHRISTPGSSISRPSRWQSLC